MDDHYAGLAGDPSFCVRLDGAGGGADFGFSGSYSALRGNGCPGELAFDVLAPLASGAGNLVYTDQDAGGAETMYASTSNEQIPGGTPSNPANFRVLLDGFSLHYLRTVPDGWTGEDCGVDSAAITVRVAEAFAWMGATTDVCQPFVPIGTPSDGGSPPAITRLHRSAPNPFNPTTTLRYDLARSGHVCLVVHDVAGRRVRALVDGEQIASAYRIRWDGRDDAGDEVASGVYWARLTTSRGFTGATKLVVLK